MTRHGVSVTRHGVRVTRHGVRVTRHGVRVTKAAGVGWRRVGGVGGEIGEGVVVGWGGVVRRASGCGSWLSLLGGWVLWGFRGRATRGESRGYGWGRGSSSSLRGSSGARGLGHAGAAAAVPAPGTGRRGAAGSDGRRRRLLQTPHAARPCGRTGRAEGCERVARARLEGRGYIGGGGGADWQSFDTPCSQAHNPALSACTWQWTADCGNRRDAGEAGIMQSSCMPLQWGSLRVSGWRGHEGGAWPPCSNSLSPSLYLYLSISLSLPLFLPLSLPLSPEGGTWPPWLGHQSAEDRTGTC